jgi:hypothetical protein
VALSALLAENLPERGFSLHWWRLSRLKSTYFLRNMAGTPVAIARCGGRDDAPLTGLEISNMVPPPTPRIALPSSEIAIPAGIAVDADHPFVIVAWLAAGIVIAAGLGPWLSKAIGVMLPAFAFVRTRA